MKRLSTANFKWQYLGHGTYNKVYVSERTWSVFNTKHRLLYQGHLVYRQAIETDPDEYPYTLARTEPGRFIDNWKRCNTPYPVAHFNHGVIVPFLGRQQASDAEVAKTVLSIYRNHRLIITDAMAKGNCLTYQNKTWCIDFDVAYHRNRDQDVLIHEDLYDEEYADFWLRWSQLGYAQSVSVVRSLVRIDDARESAEQVSAFVKKATIKELVDLDKAIIRRQLEPALIIKLTFDIIRNVLIPLQSSQLTRQMVDNQSVLHYACFYGMLNQVRQCLRLHADINFQDRLGNTPLMYAISSKQAPVIRALLNVNGIDLTIKNNKQQNLEYYVDRYLSKTSAIYHEIKTKIRNRAWGSNKCKRRERPQGTYSSLFSQPAKKIKSSDTSNKLAQKQYRYKLLA